jgi:hypothetical protein
MTVEEYRKRRSLGACVIETCTAPAMGSKSLCVEHHRNRKNIAGELAKLKHIWDNCKRPTNHAEPECQICIRKWHLPKDCPLQLNRDMPTIEAIATGRRVVD